MQPWEYRVEIIPVPALGRALNVCGAEGWDLVGYELTQAQKSVIATGPGDGSIWACHCVFKRPVQRPADAVYLAAGSRHVLGSYTACAALPPAA